MMFRLGLLGLMMFLVLNSSIAQSYVTNGNARHLSGDCYQLTADSINQIGTVWFSELTDISKPIDFMYYANFGNDGWGADGMVFVMQTVGTDAIGLMGLGIGFAGFQPSFGIEFDTYDNKPYNSDIDDDHIAFLRDGNTDHVTGNLAGPTEAYKLFNIWPQDITDGADHYIRIHWDPTNNNLMSVYFDCQLRLSMNYDLVGNIFGGDPFVYWGFTSATGALTNQHVVCIEPNLVDVPDTVYICEGSGANIQAIGAGSTGGYSWTPNYYISSTTSENPYVDPPVSTTYYVSSEDECGYVRTDSVRVIVRPYPVPQAPDSDSVCLSGSVLIDAGDTGSAYAWSTGGISQTELVTPVGNEMVYVTVTDTLANCSSIDSTNITVSSTLSADAGSDTSVCIGASITFTASGGDFYLWNDGSTDQQLFVTATADETFYVTVSDAGGCTGTDNVSVTVYGAPVAEAGDSVYACEGELITLTATGGDSYTWSNGVVQGSSFVPAAQYYYVTVANAGGCTDTDSVFVQTVPGISISLGGNQQICPGYSVLLDAGSSYSSYLWSNGETTQTASFSVGNASVTVIDGTGCSGYDTISISEYPQTTTNLGTDQQLCDGSSANLDAGSGFVSYLWQDGSTLQSYIANSAGNYSVTVTDANSCTDSDSVLIQYISSPSVNLGVDFSACASESSTVSAGGSFSGYVWNTGATTSSVNVPSSGIYSVTVSDVNGCTGVDSVYANIIENPIVDIGNNLTACTGSSLNLDPGNGFSSYSWSTGSTTQTIEVSSNGTYSVEVSDANGCTASDDVNVSFSSSIIIDLGPNQTICEGQTATFNVGTGYADYAWSDGSTTSSITVSMGGVYSVTVSDNTGCFGYDNVGLSYYPVATVDLGPDEIACSGEVITVDAGNSYSSYLWQDGSTTQTNSTNSDLVFYVTVTDSNGCTATDDILVTYGAPLSVNIGQDTVICQGGSLLLDAGNGFSSYLWSDGKTTQTNSVTQTGIYTVIVSNANSCTATDTVNIGVSSVIQPDLGPNQTMCGTSSISLDAGSGYNGYFWSDGSITQSIVIHGEGDYSVTVTDNNGCTAADSILITDAQTVAADAGPDFYICDGKTVNLSASGGADYQWSNGSTLQQINVSPSITTVYHVTVSQSVCSGTDSVTVYVNNPSGYPAVSFNVVQPQCQDMFSGAATAIANGGTSPFSYMWNNGSTTSSISSIIAGTYTVTVTDDNLCSVVNSVMVEEESAFSVTISGIPENICPGVDFVISATPDGGQSPFSFQWSNGSTNQNTVMNLSQDDSVNVKVTDVYGCEGSVSQLLILAPEIELSLQASSLEACNGEEVVLTSLISGGIGSVYTVYYNGAVASPVFSIYPQSDASHVIMVTDGCRATKDSVFVSISDDANAIISVSDNYGCVPMSISVADVSGTPGQSYMWSFGTSDGIVGIGSQTQHTYSSPGNYTISVTVTTGNGCEGVFELINEVHVSARPSASFIATPTKATVMNPVISFHNYSEAYSSVLWDFGDGTQSVLDDPIHSYSAAGLYTVELIAESEYCSDTASTDIVIEEENTFYAPNAFTPDNDLENGIFNVSINGVDRNSFKLQIFDRWGQVVFETYNIDRGWDGRTKDGSIAPVNVYTWRVEFSYLSDGKHQERCGTVTVIR